MNSNRFEAQYTYDYDLDILNIEIKEKYAHEKTVELEFGVFLDFDENYIPVNLEIISASKIMGAEKDFLRYCDGEVNVTVEDRLIDVEMEFKFKKVKFKAINEYGIGDSKTVLALTA